MITWTLAVKVTTAFSWSAQTENERQINAQIHICWNYTKFNTLCIEFSGRNFLNELYQHEMKFHVIPDVTPIPCRSSDAAERTWPRPTPRSPSNAGLSARTIWTRLRKHCALKENFYGRYGTRWCINCYVPNVPSEGRWTSCPAFDDQSAGHVNHSELEKNCSYEKSRTDVITTPGCRKPNRSEHFYVFRFIIDTHKAICLNSRITII